MINYSMWQHDPQDEKKRIATISFKWGRQKTIKAMTDKQKQDLVDMIGRFEDTLAITKKEIQKQLTQ